MCNKASANANKPQGLHRGKTSRELRTYLKNHEWVCGDDVEGHPEMYVGRDISVGDGPNRTGQMAAGTIRTSP